MSNILEHENIYTLCFKFYIEYSFLILILTYRIMSRFLQDNSCDLFSNTNSEDGWYYVGLNLYVFTVESILNLCVFIIHGFKSICHDIWTPYNITEESALTPNNISRSIAKLNFSKYLLGMMWGISALRNMTFDMFNIFKVRHISFYH